MGQSTEGISCFWAPLLCASLASDDVFVTDLAGIRVLSPMDTLTSAGACLACLKKPKFQRAGFLSGNNVLLVSVCLCVHALLLSAEGQICSPGSITGHACAMDPEWARGTSSSHLELSWPTVQTTPLISEETWKLSKANQSLYFRMPS